MSIFRREPTFKCVSCKPDELYPWTKLYVRRWWGWQLVQTGIVRDIGQQMIEGYLRREFDRVKYFNADGSRALEVKP